MELDYVRPYLEREITCKILKFLYDRPARSISEIASETGEPKTTVHEHVGKLRDAGILKVEAYPKGLGHKCRLPEDVKDLLQPIFYSHAKEPLKYLRDMDIVASAPSAFYFLGFWKSGFAVLLPTDLRVYVGIRQENRSIVPRAFELVSGGLSANIYEKTDLVYSAQILNSINTGLQKMGVATSDTAKLIGLDNPPELKVIYEPPLRSGLAASSALSAAISVATVKLLQIHGSLNHDIIETKKGGLSEEEKVLVYRLALGPEAILRKHFEVSHAFGTRLFVSVHGTPFKGGNILFREKYQNNMPVIKSFSFHIGNLPILVADSGGEVGSRLSVQKLVEFQDNFPIVDNICETISQVAKIGRKALVNMQYEKLGKSLSITHRLLDSIGQTSERTNELVQVLENAGAYGVRAIGYEKEACVIALYPPEKKDELVSSVKKPARVVLEEIQSSVPGVRIE